jgi:Class II flagellar assembly regulator
MVEGVRSVGIGGPAPVTRDGTKMTDGRFSVDDGIQPATRKTQPSSVAALGLGSMLALQGIDETEERNRGARKRGTAMLAALKDLQRALLGNEDPSMPLRTLSELAASESPAEDPGLIAILRAIDLRSRIEIARRARGLQGR